MRRARWTAPLLAAAIAAAGASIAPASADADLWLHLCGSNGAGALQWSAIPPPAGIRITGACPGTGLVMKSSGTAVGGAREALEVVAPPGITIVHFWIDNGLLTVNRVNDGTGYGGGSFWAGGGDAFTDSMTGYSSPMFRSSYAGVQIICGWDSCTDTGANVLIKDFNVQAIEASGPPLTAIGSNNLWYQGSRFVRGVWPISLQATDPYTGAQDPTGACSMEAWLGTAHFQGPVVPPVGTVWDQCDPTGAVQTWTQSVDTSSLNGPATLTFKAVNAASVPTIDTETLNFDNTPVGLSLGLANDPAPQLWANHSVTVVAAPTVGPSGLGGINCSVDGGPVTSYPAGGLTVDGTGTHTVSCAAWNNSFDASGSPASATASTAFKIDETPPSVVLEPQDPTNPTQVIVDVSDAQSGLQGGSIAMRPDVAGSAWTTLPTQFDGSHLIASFDDAHLTGPYLIQATSCDLVGNCGTAQTGMTMPVRLATASDVSFQAVINPMQTKRVRETVLVGWHWKLERRHGKRVRVKVGGHKRTIVVIKRVQRCTTTRVQVAQHRWVIRQSCHAPEVRLVHATQVAYGGRVTVHGLLRTVAGVPIAGEPVQVLAAPSNGTSPLTPAAVATTDGSGNWTAMLPAGPSRTIEAVYAGSRTLLPAGSQASVTVPAYLHIRITPMTAAWGSTIAITGQVDGGYIPTGKLLRLNVGTAQIGQLAGLPDIQPDGHFTIMWKFARGRGVLHPWFSVSTLPEAAFPFTPATSNRVTITLGTKPSKPRSPRRHAPRRRPAA